MEGGKRDGDEGEREKDSGYGSERIKRLKKSMVEEDANGTSVLVFITCTVLIGS